MKKITVLIAILMSLQVMAINVKNKPHVITQPDGTQIKCFMTGDEFGGMIHDANGYSFVKNKKDGWWYYSVKEENQVKSSSYIVGRVNPKEKGLKK